jgi:hypothetical protein
MIETKKDRQGYHWHGRAQRSYPALMLATPNEAQRGLLAQIGRAALGLVLDTAPPLCAACRQPVGSGRGLCAACWSKVSFIAPPYCERLGIPFGYDPGPGILSMEAIADPPSYGRARAAVRFDDVARDLVHALKYGDRLDLATTVGQWMARAGRELPPRPTRWCRCRCIGGGCGRGASTRPRLSPR